MSRNNSKPLMQCGCLQRVVWISLLGVCCLTSGDVLAQPPVVADRVVIDSGWGGLSPDSPLETSLTVVRAGDRYTMTGTSRRRDKSEPVPTKTVSASDVAQLVAAMTAAPQAQVDLQAIGLNIAKLQPVIDKQWDQEALSTAPAEVQSKAKAFRESLREAAPLAALVTRGFSGFHTDDFPGISVDVALSDGSKLAVGSRSQHYQMLPWKNASGQETYSPDIAHAVWNLLPTDATNKERLDGVLRDYELDELVRAGLADQQDRFQAEAKAGGALAVLESRFKVLTAQVIEGYDNKGSQLRAELQLPDTPSNLVLQTQLRITGGALTDGARDIARIAGQLELAQTAPAMAARIKAAPARKFRINDRFGWSWLDARTSAQFVQQMQALHRLPELKTHPDLMRNAVMVEEGIDPIYWIVLADRRAIMWKQFTDAVATPDTQRCKGVPMDDDDDLPPELSERFLCIGRVFGADGAETR